MSKSHKQEEVAATMQEAQQYQNLVEFDDWWAQRMSKIPSVHRKEIIKADFRGRKIVGLQTMEAFDAALEEYGIQL
jgi:hypothetical protein